MSDGRAPGLREGAPSWRASSRTRSASANLPVSGPLLRRAITPSSLVPFPLWATALFFLAGSRLQGADNAKPLAQYFHSAWMAEEGAPAAAKSMAQTTDGYLWFGTPTGLFRFDGVRFDRYASTHRLNFPSLDVSTLLPAPNGGLWIGYRTGGVSFLKDDTLVNYGKQEGLPSAQILQFALDTAGALWVVTSRGPLRFHDSKWEAVGNSWGFTSSQSRAVCVDSQGRVWITADDQVFRLDPGARFFHPQPLPKAVGVFQTADGALWTFPDAMKWALPSQMPWRVPVQSKQNATEALSGNSRLGCCSKEKLIPARDGSIWTDQLSTGITRIPDAQWLEGLRGRIGVDRSMTFNHENGLSDNWVDSMLEDREGNIWVATRRGVDRFRRRNVFQAPSSIADTTTPPVIAVDGQGVLWTSANNEPLMRIEDGFATPFVNKMRSANENPPVSIYCSRDGVVWIGTTALTRFANGRFVNVLLPPAVTPPQNWNVRAITEDAGGSLWVSIVQHGVYRLQGAVWQQYGGISALPQLTAVALWTDMKRRVWFGYTDSRIALLDGGRVRTFSGTDGIAVGNVTAFAGHDNHVWAGGALGLARYDGERFRMVTSKADLDFTGISGIVETESGDLWINQSSGVVHVAASELENRLRNPGYPLRYELFGAPDGLRGTPPQLNSLPSIALGKGGRIWVSTTEGLSWIDSAHILRNPLPPPVSIESMVVDGKAYSLRGKIEIPPLSSNLEIDYAALSLSIPERVRFRYQLSDVDATWRDVGTRRSAFYTKLSPGTYRFRVIACNNDGVWNETGATLGFVVAPAFYQTWWFRSLCAAATVFALWLFYLYSLMQETVKVQERLGARLEERERIARELHDTLLQGFQGLMLRFQAVMKTLPEHEPARQMMEKVMERADEVLLEGRQSVRDIRRKGTTRNELFALLSQCCEELGEGHSTPFSVVVLGSAQALDPVVFDETYRIAREALINAFQHSHAAKIEVELAYESSGVSLKVRDDGKGMDSRLLNVGKAGHWGLSGMRERAEKVGAKLNVWSRPGAGTEIDLTIPANIAYRRELKLPLWHRLARAAGEYRNR